MRLSTPTLVRHLEAQAPTANTHHCVTGSYGYFMDKKGLFAEAVVPMFELMGFSRSLESAPKKKRRKTTGGRGKKKRSEQQSVEQLREWANERKEVQLDWFTSDAFLALEVGAAPFAEACC